MARPKADADAIRSTIFAHAEAQLRESGGARLRLADIAAVMGRAPSYVHLHFRTKHDLVAALAERWFGEVEAAVARAHRAAGSPREQLRAQVLATLAVKRAKFDADPDLFRAYLQLAGQHGDIARQHALLLRDRMRSAVRELVDDEAVETTLDMVEDATAQFRVPHMIALYPERATPERAERVLDVLLAPGRHGVANA